MKVSGPTILISAGEASGDLHGAALAHALLRKWPEARLVGLGGSRMAEAGVELLCHIDRLGVIGFVEAVRHLPHHLRLYRRLCLEIDARRPELVLPIDYPGFNLRLARAAHTRGSRVLYYIPPQVWAWHSSRARQLARSTDRLAVVLPFEEQLFRELGARATFVGHPLLDSPPPRGTRADICGALGLDPNRQILALFPGSRDREVERHLDLFVAAANRVVAARPALQPVIAASAAVRKDAYATAPFPCTFDSWDLLHHAHLALVKSGTGTLEAALAGAPMVIAYRTHPVTFWIARRLVTVEHVGLANLVAGERLVPEYLQGDATPEALADALLPLADDDAPARREAVAGLARVREALKPRVDGVDSVADHVAQLAAELLEG